MFLSVSDVLHQDVPEPGLDPQSQGPASPTSVAPAQVTIKEEQQIQHLPPAGSVDNPMEIDNSDYDETAVQGSAMTPKRKMKGVCIVDNLLVFLKLSVSAPPPGGETPTKRSKSANNQISGVNDLSPAASSGTGAVSVKTAEPSKQPVRGLTESFES